MIASHQLSPQRSPIFAMSGLGHGPSSRLDHCAGSTAVVREIRQMSAISTRPKLKEGQSQFGFAPVVQTSTCSALARASSTSMARYLTVLSIFELGLATAKAFRGRRFAAAATAAWSRLPSLQSRLFYSTGRNNISSQRVAARLVLQLRGASCGSHNLRSRSSASGREWS